MTTIRETDSRLVSEVAKAFRQLEPPARSQGLYPLWAGAWDLEYTNMPDALHFKGAQVKAALAACEWFYAIACTDFDCATYSVATFALAACRDLVANIEAILPHFKNPEARVLAQIIRRVVLTRQAELKEIVEQEQAEEAEWANQKPVPSPF